MERERENRKDTNLNMKFRVVRIRKNEVSISVDKVLEDAIEKLYEVIEKFYQKLEDRNLIGKNFLSKR